MTTSSEQIETGLAQYTPAASPVLSLALVGVRTAIRDAAQFNVDQVLSEDPDYSVTEIQAMMLVEELRQVNGLDLAAVLMRAELVNKIIAENAIASHPGGYANLREMAQDQGISVSELSDTMGLVNIIFPYIRDVLGRNVALEWERIGKSKLREMLPLIRVLIEGPEATNRQAIRDTAERLVDDAVQVAEDGGVALSGDSARATVVETLMDQGALLTVNELRTHLRPERTPSVTMRLLPLRSGHALGLIDISPDQMVMLRNRLGGYVDVVPTSLPLSADQRQLEMLRMTEVRALMDLMER